MKALFILSALFLVACAERKYEPSASEQVTTAEFASRLRLDLSWEQLPTDTDPGSFVIQTYRKSPVDGTKVPADPGTVKVLLWMPSMGHGSAPTRVERLGEGRFRVTDVFFVMRGDWQIRIQTKNEQGAADEAVLAYAF